MKNKKIAVIGLGYVGLPLAVEFGKIREVVGFDINDARVSDLKCGKDKTLEISPEEINGARELSFTTDAKKIHKCDIFFIKSDTVVMSL